MCGLGPPGGRAWAKNKSGPSWMGRDQTRSPRLPVHWTAPVPAIVHPGAWRGAANQCHVPAGGIRFPGAFDAAGGGATPQARPAHHLQTARRCCYPHHQPALCPPVPQHPESCRHQSAQLGASGRNQKEARPTVCTCKRRRALQGDGRGAGTRWREWHPTTDRKSNRPRKPSLFVVYDQIVSEHPDVGLVGWRHLPKPPVRIWRQVFSGWKADGGTACGI